MSLKLIRYNYEERDIARLLVLLSWSGTVTIESATKLATAFLTKKIKSLGITSLVPIIVCKIQAHCQLMMRPDGSQLDIIFGLLTNGSSKLTWGLTRQLVGCYYIYIEAENDLQNQLQLELNRKGKGCAINVNIAKGSVYLRLATKEAGGEDAWQILFDTTKASITIITFWQGYDKIIKKFQAYKAYGKKLAILVDTFGLGILLSLNAQDAIEVGNLAISKWSSAIPKALVEMARRFPDAVEFREINAIVSSILPDLVTEKINSKEALAPIINYVVENEHISVYKEIWENIRPAPKYLAQLSANDRLIDYESKIKEVVKAFPDHSAIGSTKGTNKIVINRASMESLMPGNILDAEVIHAIITLNAQIFTKHAMVIDPRKLRDVEKLKKVAKTTIDVLAPILLGENDAAYWVAAVTRRFGGVGRFWSMTTVYDPLGKSNSCDDASEVMNSILKHNFGTDVDIHETISGKTPPLIKTFDSAIYAIQNIICASFASKPPVDLKIPLDSNRLRFEWAADLTRSALANKV
ncbi:hypothetical protein BCIN_09g05730 [Botrytis cinerea B05.10]|uniref:Uncharacterized protein n=1 Tax=Botryotinia fuckeliana (strain B05.10) TaxID=332648 RepID=A0A384JT84_BOTFB|nr:hypothetical protein BCIN_09g05730 [Botrytis cinerea B05.10]ATZ53798.1 hypothetical protein BCIN_09g05730 [Botrytis cinerea B05.10]